MLMYKDEDREEFFSAITFAREGLDMAENEFASCHAYNRLQTAIQRLQEAQRVIANLPHALPKGPEHKCNSNVGLFW